jgi:hypothetical protein
MVYSYQELERKEVVKMRRVLRKNQVCVRLSDEERELLEEYANSQSSALSAVVRNLTLQGIKRWRTVEAIAADPAIALTARGSAKVGKVKARK